MKKHFVLSVFLLCSYGLGCVVADDDAGVSQKIAVIKISGSIPEGVGQSGMFADVSPRLHRVVERIEQAATDSSIHAVLLSIHKTDIGRGRMIEIMSAIERVQHSGKPVVAHFVSGGPVLFTMATCCDSISMPPASTLEVTGVRVEVTFYKAMLDALGIDAEILQVGEFKGAGEPMTRNSMSPQLRKQYEEFVGDLYDQFIEQIAKGRNLELKHVRDLVDIGVFTPESAQEAGLIDAIAYEDEAISGLAAHAGINQPVILHDYATREVDNDFSGIGGMVKLLEIFSGSGKKFSKSSRKQIAIVYVNGEIQEGQASGGFLGGMSGGSGAIIEAIREANSNKNVVAIVLRINSPGGSALASDLIWREVERAEKPVVASLSDTAASGGYYVAVAADRIVAAPGTLTGSIGVVGGKIAIGRALGKVGVHTDVVSKGRNAGWLSMQTPFATHEKEVFLTTMRQVYQLFTSKVADGRRFDKERVTSLAEGRIFTGRMEKEVGLVDSLGTLDDAIEEARKLANLGAQERLDRLLLPQSQGLFDDLFGQLSSDEAAPLVNKTLRNMIENFPGAEHVIRWIDSLSLLSAGKPLMMLPAKVSIH